MTVYIVVSHWGEYEDRWEHILGVFDSEEKAQECVTDMEKSQTLNEEECKLYNSFEIVLEELESTLFNVDHIEIDSEEWDKELEKRFETKTGYDMDQYYELERKIDSDYRGCRIIIAEVQ